ncbi:NAD(P)H-hydrate dehydratase [Pseudoxanthomonas mexicana]|jgi:ADP-dependent NAD(P)H-hydrate dehydratase|uniref:ADP-dependent (S)-NAD(P)H-hydrate dehydratase n=1 Tax=Pseudoxanthomonas mexicana TaxID=128785 RepID=A0ABX6RDI9_PSEMX|nr:NAD(P)H-hydrate dehydratase [Pseudoxanthomonas mexicana]PZQ31239.1 MAG: NAD(P)H-hydrate dehydratase [Stenotrophomonas acidaminiphila]QND80982.1 NAD(P)H-hydrate dehydratase [Pseudoxanthomonas mexicana]
MSQPRDHVLDETWLAAHPLPAAQGAHSKEDRGRVIVIGGSVDIPGAILLAAQAALRAGAGKLQMAVPGPSAFFLAPHMPEARVLGQPSDEQGQISGMCPACRQEAERADAIVVGPGMCDSPALASLLGELPNHPTLVLDAGAITCFKQAHVRSQAAILTPHAGEMAKLLGCEVDQISGDEPALALQAAKDLHVVLVLKGPSTWVASPTGELVRYEGGGVGLATSGSGDVLAGVIGGLAARGAEPLIAAAWGVFLHGQAGRHLAERMGALGFLAREISPCIPEIMHALSPPAR